MRRIVSSHSSSGPFEMISIPLEPVLAAWVKRYRLMEKKLEKAKREWQLFEENASPHYQKWYYSTFAEDLSRLTDSNQKAREQESILMGIVAHQKIYRLDEFQAYARVKERLRQKLGPFPDPADVERYESAERERAEKERKHREAIREKRKKEAEEFWASEAEAKAYSEQISEAFEKIFDEPKAEPTVRSRDASLDKKQDDLRAVYRSIVRALHPDTGHEMTDVEKDWWNQAQVAYRNSDLETLKLLSLRLQGQGEVEIDKIDHVGTLIELCAALFEQQEQLDRQRKHLKRDPVYRFWMSRSKTSARDKLSFELRAQLHTQLRRLKDFTAEVKSRLNELDRFGSRYDEDAEETEFNPRDRKRATLGKPGRGRGRGRGR